MDRESDIRRSSIPEFDYLLELARDRSEAGRSLLVNSVCDLFIESEHEYSVRESTLMNSILCQLIVEVESEVRQDLAERLSGVAAAPRELIFELANDEFSVAQSVLRNSPILRDPDLVEIIRYRAREHQLAIAAREEIGESVSEALVDTGDVGVITTLLDNAGAVISDLTMDYLVEQSERIDEYQHPLLHREELTSALAKKMYVWVSAALREHVADRFDIPQNELDKALDGAVSSAASGTNTAQPTDKASALVDQLARSDRLTAQSLIQVLHEGEIALFETMFARFAGLEIALIKKVLYEAGGQSLAVACKASHIQAHDFASIYRLSRKARPGEMLVDTDELAKVLEFFDRIEVGKSEKVVQKWRMRPDLRGLGDAAELDPVSDDDVPSPPPEREAAQSTKILKPGQIVFHHNDCVIDCLVVEISEDGAVLVSPNLLVCPKTFTLNIGPEASYNCEVAWHHGDKMAVRFLDT